MSKADYYQVLGVTKNASDDEIKKAFKRMAMKYHPDRNPDKTAEAKFKECKEAYEVLSNPQKRAAYDQFGHAGVNQQGPGGFGGFGGGGFGGAEGVDLGDIFGDIFGEAFGGGRRRGGGRSSSQGGGQRGADLRFTITLTLEEAVSGITKDIRVPTLISCQDCNGSGAKKGSKPTTCSYCKGAGQVRMQQGFFSVQQTCPACHGSGQVISDPCTSCKGQGRKQGTRHLSVKIPAGVDEGDRIRLANEGEAGTQGASAGDLFVEVQVTPHSIFKREGANLFCAVPLSFTMAALGGEVEVPTLTGRIKLKIPPETQTGRLFRLKGKGVKPLRGYQTGDLICQVTVETPVNLGTKQREILESFEQSMSDDPSRFSPQKSHWFDGVKRFFDSMKF